MGGKDPLIVCADANVEAAARAAVWGGFLNAGQVCTSLERVYVEQEVAASFTECVVELTRKLTLGPGMEESSEVTPMIRDAERGSIMKMVDEAKASGGSILTGGRIPPGYDRGFYYEPTVLTGVSDDMRLMQEEIFGPLLPVITVADFDEALNRANASVYGLGATLFTNDPRKVKRYMEEIEVGNVWVNDPIVDNVAGPFGGMKRSGLGRELGEEGYEAFTETKHVHWEMEGGIKSWWYPWQ
jgi:betaine-aldehyde dehydrogenase